AADLRDYVVGLGTQHPSYTPPARRTVAISASAAGRDDDIVLGASGALFASSAQSGTKQQLSALVDVVKQCGPVVNWAVAGPDEAVFEFRGEESVARAFSLSTVCGQRVAVASAGFVENGTFLPHETRALIAKAVASGSRVALASLKANGASGPNATVSPASALVSKPAHGAHAIDQTVNTLVTNAFAAAAAAAQHTQQQQQQQASEADLPPLPELTPLSCHTSEADPASRPATPVIPEFEAGAPSQVQQQQQQQQHHHQLQQQLQLQQQHQHRTSPAVQQQQQQQQQPGQAAAQALGARATLPSCPSAAALDPSN
ncbi:hypothetical protein DIPPA_29332, partial [Diplonema papillatum]